MNKLDVLIGVDDLGLATSKNISQHFKISLKPASWFLLRLYRQGLLTRELQEKTIVTRGKKPYAYKLTHEARTESNIWKPNFKTTSLARMVTPISKS